VFVSVCQRILCVPKIEAIMRLPGIARHSVDEQWEARVVGLPAGDVPDVLASDKAGRGWHYDS